MNGRKANITQTETIQPRGNKEVFFCPPEPGENNIVYVSGPSNNVTLNVDFKYYGVFVTSLSYRGDSLGFVRNIPDGSCQSLADVAGVGGRWKAWLSDSAHSLVDGFFHSPDPHALVDCTRIADNWRDLTDGSLQTGINITVGGDPLHGVVVWTGTFFNGSGTGLECGDWIDPVLAGTQGISGGLGLEWTGVGVVFGCNAALPIYCFEQP